MEQRKDGYQRLEKKPANEEKKLKDTDLSKVSTDLLLEQAQQYLLEAKQANRGTWYYGKPAATHTPALEAEQGFLGILKIKPQSKEALEGLVHLYRANYGRIFNQNKATELLNKVKSENVSGSDLYNWAKGMLQIMESEKQGKQKAS